MDDGVVGAVEPSAVPGVGHGPLAAVRLQPADAAVAVLAGDQPTLAVEREAVAARLITVGHDPGEPRRVEVHTQSGSRLPAMHPVAGNVGKQQVTCFLHPDGSLRPRKPAGQDLDLRVPGYECFEPRVEAFDRSDRGQQVHRRPIGDRLRRRDNGSAEEHEGPACVAA
jgi:hypothetical protein